MRILWRYIAFEYVKAFLGTLLGLAAIWLVVEYVDKSKNYSGEGWLRAVIILYACRAVSVAHELAPGALLLAAGITAAGLRKRGEYAGMRALAIGPSHVLIPLLVTSLVLASGLVIINEYLVGPARYRIDQINAGVFKNFGSWGRYFGDIRWFSGKNRIYHLREGNVDKGFSNVTIFSLSDDFRISKRIDAKRMTPLEGHRWLLENGSERAFKGDNSEEVLFEKREYIFEENPTSFRIMKGRPEQMRFRELSEQIDVRRRVGLTADNYLFAFHNKISYPIGGVPGGFLAALSALRPGRRNYLISALVEGFSIIIASWAFMVVFKAASLAGLISVATAAWAPAVVLTMMAGVGLWLFAK